MKKTTNNLYPFSVKVQKIDNPEVTKTYKIRNEEDLAIMLAEAKENNKEG